VESLESHQRRKFRDEALCGAIGSPALQAKPPAQEIWWLAPVWRPCRVLVPARNGSVGEETCHQKLPGVQQSGPPHFQMPFEPFYPNALQEIDIYFYIAIGCLGGDW
jgi:hypothetical protein